MIPFGKKAGKSFVRELAKLTVCSPFSCFDGLFHDTAIAFAETV